MILTNLAKAVREQNWFAVALEFVIVIAGVVIGFQITQWNDARTDRARADEYLSRIEEETYRNFDRAIDRVIAWRWQAEAGERALEYIRTGSVPQDDAWRLVVDFNYVGDVNQFRSELSTFEELRSSGRLNLIRNSSIRSFLMQYAGAANSNVFRLGTSRRDDYRESVRQRTPPRIYMHIKRACTFLAPDSDATAIRDCAPPDGVSDEAIVTLLETYRADTQLVDELRAATNALGEAAYGYTQLVRYFEPVINQMREELGMELVDEVSVRLGATAE
ncbi:hypothetical protein V0U79_10785 [Hyphobacterium sp. HN65]|uniref:Uncharacterized protein n=1 Tax=Hyphobacterium lacteum TaxID=3116575 RepID=A0ABU7LSF8_9PROT|nr:hypothetical protein [Hyphobacterium sp. HN65]MEE2526857.1 hypothetical protein [Hyphobacterium sp. HN65]